MPLDEQWREQESATVLDRLPTPTIDASASHGDLVVSTRQQAVAAGSSAALVVTEAVQPELV